MNTIKIPGFTAEATLANTNTHYQVGTNSAWQTKALNLSREIIPQTFGGHPGCYWRCYPGSGCEFVCQDFPF